MKKYEQGEGCNVLNMLGFPGDSVVKNSPASAGDARHGFDLWVWKIDPLEKEMASHSSMLAWKIPWTEEPGGLQSKGSQRVRHHRATEHTQETQILPASQQGQYLPVACSDS